MKIELIDNFPLTKPMQDAIMKRLDDEIDKMMKDIVGSKK